ncbi:MAG: hypothetical protein ACE5ED_00100 [Rhodothalassiaceae bacterium]
MTRKMTENRFAALVAAYGADPARWPDAERGAAQAFAASAEGRRHLAAAARLDRQLAQLPPPAPASRDLLARLEAIPASRPFAQEGALARLVAGFAAILTPRALAGEIMALALAIGAGLWLGAHSGGERVEAFDLSNYVLGGELDLPNEDGK